MDGFQELARNISGRFKVSCEFECPEPVPLHDAVSSTHLYRIAQEAITNAVKHGKARHISIGLEKINGTIILTVTDGGIGLPENARNGQGLGLRIICLLYTSHDSFFSKPLTNLFSNLFWQLFDLAVSFFVELEYAKCA